MNYKKVYTCDVISACHLGNYWSQLKYSQGKLILNLCDIYCNICFNQSHIFLLKTEAFIYIVTETLANMNDYCCSQGEFVDDGTETHFTIGETHPAYIKAVSSGKRREGIIHSLFVADVEIPLSKEWCTWRPSMNIEEYNPGVKTMNQPFHQKKCTLQACSTIHTEHIWKQKYLSIHFMDI